MTDTYQPKRMSMDKLALAANRKVKEQDYWLEKLSGEPPLSTFPYDYQETKISKDKAVYSFTMDEPLTRRLLELAAGSDARLHMVIVTAVMALLARYSGNTDIVTGAPVFNSGAGGEELINTALPLRAEIDENISFKELLLNIKTTVLEAAENQAYPFEILMDKLNPSGGNRDFSLFDTAVVLENIQETRLLDYTPARIVFVFLREGSTIKSRIQYDPQCYLEDTVRRLALHFSRLLERAAAELDSPLLTMEFLSETERRELLVDFSGIESDFPRDKTIVRLFEEQAGQSPGKIAVTWNGRQLTYRQLNEKSNQLAHFLREKGVGVNRVVAVSMERSLDLAVTILAVLKAGAAYLPIDPDYPESRIRRVLDSSGASLLLTHTGAVHALSFTMLRNQLNPGGPTPVLTAMRSQIESFDELPRPDRTLVDYRKYHQNIGIAPVKRTISLQTSRGCPYSCLYCHRIWPKKHLVRNAANIYEEIRWGYEAGIRDFVFVDDIFNLDKTNSRQVLESIINDGLKVRLYYPNGLRADILDKEFIDLMVEAGAVNIDVALESACPRIQKLMKKHLNLDKFRENIHYISQTYPHVILEMEMMHGFPTETEEEALMTFDFLKSIRWIHFPNLNILKIFPNTDMYRLAIEHGVSKRAIENSTNYAYHELPDTLPVPKSFTRQLQARLLEEYFLSKERMLAVLPQQMKILTEDELIKKYDTYLPMEIRTLGDILEAAGIRMEELGDVTLKREHEPPPADFNTRIEVFFPKHKPVDNAFRFLMLDLSQFFSSESVSKLYDVTEEPLGLMYLMTYLNRELGPRIHGKIAKSGIDFNSYQELMQLISGFNPHLIGIRTLSYYREFFHRTVSMIKAWGVKAPVISGGPYATSDYTIMLKDPDIDLAVLGEGEYTTLELVQKMIANQNRLPSEEELKTIAGIAFMPGQGKEELKTARRDILMPDILEHLIRPYPVSNPEPAAGPEDLLYLISTSGSTGTPKSVMMKHRSLVNLVHFQQHHTAIDFESVMQFASIAFDVSFQEIFSTLLSGGTIHLLSDEVRANISLMLDFIRENQVKTLFLPPAFVKFIFDEPEYAAAFPSCVRHIVTAGEQLVVTDPMRRYLKANNVYLHNHYGPAETHVVSSFTMAPGDEIPHLPHIGKPIANTRILILDRRANLQPVGVAGELCVHGEAVGKGSQLLDIESVKEAVVIDRRTSSEDVYLCAYIVPSNGGMEFEAGSIRDYLFQVLPDYMVPSHFIMLPELPLNTSGKIDRKALPLPKAQTGGGMDGLPRDDVEKKLAMLWTGVLEVPAGIDDNFFEMGGHSLKGTMLISRIHKEFNVKLLLVDVFKYPTIRTLARYLKEEAQTGQGESFQAIQPAPEQDYYPLSSAQKRLYILQQMDKAGTVYNIPMMVKVRGDLDVPQLENAFKALIKRHEALRTSFVAHNKETKQKIHEDADFKIGDIGPIGPIGPINPVYRPFDLSRAPLFRVETGKLEDGGFLLLLDMHHIISDAVTLDILIREAVALYEGSELPPLKLQYKDYSHWQNKLFESGAYKEQERFWLERFKGNLPQLDMPTDFPRPEVKSSEGDGSALRLQEELSLDIKRLAGETGATLYQFLLAVYIVLLHKYGGQDDIIVGSPVSGRGHADLQDIVGVFVNMVSVRSRPMADKQFREFLEEVKIAALAAHENQDYPFDDLVSKLGIRGGHGRNPVFDVGFLYNPPGARAIRDSSLQLTPYEAFNRVSRFDMLLGISEAEENILLNIEYSTQLFKEATIKTFLGHYREVLTQVTRDPEVLLDRITVGPQLKTIETEKPQINFGF
jgi:non-ribosomal peptide synthetase component F/acyl carrier protein